MLPRKQKLPVEVANVNCVKVNLWKGVEVISTTYARATHLAAGWPVSWANVQEPTRTTHIHYVRMGGNHEKHCAVHIVRSTNKTITSNPHVLLIQLGFK